MCLPLASRGAVVLELSERNSKKLSWEEQNDGEKPQRRRDLQRPARDRANRVDLCRQNLPSNSTAPEKVPMLAYRDADQFSIFDRCTVAQSRSRAKAQFLLVATRHRGVW